MTLWWALVGLAIFLIGVTKSGFGSGAGLMIVPMTAIALRHVPGFAGEMALPLLLPLLLVGDVIAIWQYRREFSMPIIYLTEDFKVFVGVAGVSLGAVVATALAAILDPRWRAELRAGMGKSDR